MTEASACFGRRGGSHSEGNPLPSFSPQAPPALAVRQEPLILKYMRNTRTGHHHMDSLQELPHTTCGPVQPILVAFYDRRYHTGMGIIYPPRGSCTGILTRAI
jgi:hypothetical protein